MISTAHAPSVSLRLEPLADSQRATITLNLNGRLRNLDIPDEMLIAIVRAALAKASTASNDIEAKVEAAFGVAPERRRVNSVPAQLLGGLAPGALRRVREYIDQHLTENIAIDALARVASLSTGHFNRAFKQSTGDSPHHYIIRKRIAMATELLVKSSRALSDIALDTGFADQSHFSRTYVAITGETPSACRRRHR